MSSSTSVAAPIRTTIPARLDRLGWSPFHTRMVAGLGGIDAEGKSLEDITKPLTASTPAPAVAAG